ncbi:hypothetical protein Ddye_011032 [Dipteronia dyeriana]|uniref:RNase H type-1 domain-containing protein n=1 Tax=Dipteronia dyeriana TaxID=168575 RepID=A0AAD9XER5_9ROSI|nr:hypothetical protein Ddye_011032 [Dipteronia dyeriana]
MIGLRYNLRWILLWVIFTQMLRVGIFILLLKLLTRMLLMRLRMWWLAQIQDSLVWTCSLDDFVSCKSTYTSLSGVRSSVFWEEDLRRLFLDCPFLRGLWDVVSSTFGHKLKLDGTCFDLWQEVMRFVFSTELKTLWQVSIITVFWVVWFFRNQSTFEGGKIIFVDALSLLWRSVREADSLQSGTMKNSVDELQILQRLHVSGRPPKAPRILEINWRPPPSSCLKVNTDEAAFGSPGFAGCAGVFRTSRGFVKGCFVIPLDVCFAFEAELVAAVYAIDYAWTFGWCRLWLESDSTFVVDILHSRYCKVL